MVAAVTAMVFKREYIMSGGNLSGVYHFYTMAVTAYNIFIPWYKYIYTMVAAVTAMV